MKRKTLPLSGGSPEGIFCIPCSNSAYNLYLNGWKNGDNNNWQVQLARFHYWPEAQQNLTGVKTTNSGSFTVPCDLAGFKSEGSLWKKNTAGGSGGAVIVTDPFYFISKNDRFVSNTAAKYVYIPTFRVFLFGTIDSMLVVVY